MFFKWFSFYFKIDFNRDSILFTQKADGQDKGLKKHDAVVFATNSSYLQQLRRTYKV